MGFMLKAIIIYIDEEVEFDYKNNHEHHKSANFRLDTISIVNFRLLVVILYILSGLRSRNVQSI